MISPEGLKKRFLKDPTPVRLGSIASDLTRLSGLVRSKEVNSSAFQNVLLEVKWFTELAAKDLDLETQRVLLELQRTISRFDLKNLSRSQQTIGKQAKEWSEKILALSGLC